MNNEETDRSLDKWKQWVSSKPFLVWFPVNLGTVKLCNKDRFDKELLALRNNLRATKKFLIVKFDCTFYSIVKTHATEPRKLFKIHNFTLSNYDSA